MQHLNFNMKHLTCNVQHETCNMQPSTCITTALRQHVQVQPTVARPRPNNGMDTPNRRMADPEPVGGETRVQTHAHVATTVGRRGGAPEKGKVPAEATQTTLQVAENERVAG
jgi:hypothetical protein